jgi:hypothetical protein
MPGQQNNPWDQLLVPGAQVALPAPKPGVDFSRYRRTDAGNGLAFLDLFGGTLRFTDGSWDAWNGEHWGQVCDLEMLSLARQAAEEMLRWVARRTLANSERKAWEKHADATQNVARLRAMIRLAASESLARARR